MPGYEILGFDGSWFSTDALHCRVKGIPDREMLYIEHTPLSGEQSTDNGFEIICKIKPYSGENVKIGSTCIYYRVNNNDWNYKPLQSIGNDNYNGTIPIQEDESLIEYYIHAEDFSGRIEKHPYIGASNAHSFTVNNPSTPNPPSKPNGPKKGLVELLYNYSTVSTDPNNDTLQYGWDWDGDNIVDQWSDFYESGEIINISHSWNNIGVYFVKVKARDINQYESGFSPILTVTISDNNPPNFPINPNPTNNSINISITTNLSWNCIDPDNDTITYDIYFGDLINISKIESNHTIPNYDLDLLEYNHSYHWRIVAWDSYKSSTIGPVWNFKTEAITVNYPPNNPDINGPSTGENGIQYDFTLIATDPDNDDLYYYIEWGDGTVEEWIGSYDSGEQVTFSHTWEEKNTFTIRAKVKDSEGEESNWSILEINIPKNKPHFKMFYWFLERLFHYFPMLEKILL
jgi:hypothetical protein